MCSSALLAETQITIVQQVKIKYFKVSDYVAYVFNRGSSCVSYIYKSGFDMEIIVSNGPDLAGLGQRKTERRMESASDQKREEVHIQTEKRGETET